MSLRVSPNNRYLTHPDGSPFFYLGDTAWQLFHRLDRAETELYLQDRASKGFTIIQAVILAELDGLYTPNANGDLPLHNLDPAEPNERYFQHVDWVIQRANELGLHIGLLPTWGDKWNHTWGSGPEVFTPENSKIFGEWLGRRYRDADLIWVLGGDRSVDNNLHRIVITAMAEGLRLGDEGRHLMTFHPPGCRSSSEWFHEADWLDFNMAQTGHDRHRDNAAFISADRNRTPTKPCLDGEPGYEGIPDDLQVGREFLTDADVRRSLYRSLFAGACGYTYGTNSVWQMWQPGHEPILGAVLPWQEALRLPGSSQVQHAKALHRDYPFLTASPDANLVIGNPHIQAIRNAEGRYALVYVEQNSTVELDVSRLTPGSLDARLWNPRTGHKSLIGTVSTPTMHFQPPDDQDWVLILDSH